MHININLTVFKKIINLPSFAYYIGRFYLLEQSSHPKSYKMEDVRECHPRSQQR